MNRRRSTHRHRMQHPALRTSHSSARHPAVQVPTPKGVLTEVPDQDAPLGERSPGTANSGRASIAKASSACPYTLPAIMPGEGALIGHRKQPDSFRCYGDADVTALGP